MPARPPNARGSTGAGAPPNPVADRSVVLAQATQEIAAMCRAGIARRPEQPTPVEDEPAAGQRATWSPAARVGELRGARRAYEARFARLTRSICRSRAACGEVLAWGKRSALADRSAGDHRALRLSSRKRQRPDRGSSSGWRVATADSSSASRPERAARTGCRRRSARRRDHDARPPVPGVRRVAGGGLHDDDARRVAGDRRAGLRLRR